MHSPKWTGGFATAATPPTPAQPRTSRRRRFSSRCSAAAGPVGRVDLVGWCGKGLTQCRGSMQRRGEFSVTVTKDYLVFASAHFITFAGHRCEGLHGHNYRVRVTIHGKLDEESWFVFDFVTLKH